MDGGYWNKETGIRDTLRLKRLADIFLQNGTSAYIKDLEENYYFCKIVSFDKDKIRFKCFGPPSRNGSTYELYWPLVVKLKEFDEEGSK